RVDQRLGEPVLLAGLYAVDRGRKARAVAVEAFEQRTETVEQRRHRGVQGAQVADDAGVVLGVGVIVDHRLPVLLAQLPRAGRRQQARVEPEKLSVARLDIGLAARGRKLARDQLGVQ